MKEYKKQKLERISAEECESILMEYRNLLQRFENIQVNDKRGYIEIYPGE